MTGVDTAPAGSLERPWPCCCRVAPVARRAGGLRPPHPPHRRGGFIHDRVADDRSLAVESGLWRLLPAPPWSRQAASRPRLTFLGLCWAVALPRPSHVPPPGSCTSPAASKARPSLSGLLTAPARPSDRSLGHKLPAFFSAVLHYLLH